MTTRFWVLVEDDNGRYFHVTVEALDNKDARARVAYILDKDSARILQSAVANS